MHVARTEKVPIISVIALGPSNHKTNSDLFDSLTNGEIYVCISAWLYQSIYAYVFSLERERERERERREEGVHDGDFNLWSPPTMKCVETCLFLERKDVHMRLSKWVEEHIVLPIFCCCNNCTLYLSSQNTHNILFARYVCQETSRFILLLPLYFQCIFQKCFTRLS